jgi:inner membrane protein
MQKALLLKAALVAALFVMLMIPLQMIGGLVTERQGRQQQVAQEIAASSYGKQAFAGPFIVFPYDEEWEETIDGSYLTLSRVEKRRNSEVAVFFPESMGLAGTGTVETKSRGLFRARVFNWQGTARGEFAFDGKFKFKSRHEGSRLSIGKPFLTFVVGDPRGISGTTVFRWNGKPVALERGTRLPAIDGGVHADIPDFDPSKPLRFEYALDFGLRGSEAMTIVPLAGNTTVILAPTGPPSRRTLPAARRPRSDRAASRPRGA